MALPWGHRSRRTAARRPRTVPGAAGAGSTPGVHDVNATGGQAVLGDQPLPRPVARRHHPVAGAQGDPLSGRCRRVGSPERHVCKHRQPQPRAAAASTRPETAETRRPSTRRRRAIGALAERALEAGSRRRRRAATHRAPDARAPSSPARPEPVEHSAVVQCCRRWADAGHRRRRGAPHGAVLTGTVRSLPRRRATRAASPRPGRSRALSPSEPATMRSTSRSATTFASSSVVVFVPGERRVLVEVAVVQLAQHLVQLLGRSADVDHDAVASSARRRNVASTTYVAPCSRWAGPKTSPRRLCAIIMWSRTVTLNIASPSS